MTRQSANASDGADDGTTGTGGATGKPLGSSTSSVDTTSSVTTVQGSTSQESTSMSGDETDTDGQSDDAIVLGELKAFPTAHGYGAFAAGGRGGQVIEVSTYEELRDAIHAKGPRIVVFSRSGYIESTASFLATNDGQLTVLGQTAPDPGVTLRGMGLTVSHSEVVLRRFAVRPGSSADGSGLDCVRIRTADESIDNVIFDHLSLSWSDDENFSAGAVGGVDGTDTVTNVTVQHTLSAEPTGSPYHVLVGRRVDGLSLIRNLYAHGPNRIPENTYGRDERYEFSNNLIFDYNRATTVTTVSSVDVIGNGFKEGMVPPDRPFNVTFSANGIENPDALLEDSTIFGDDNVQIGAGTSAMYNENWVTHAGGERALSDATYVAFPASQLEARLLADVGSGEGDAVDQRILADYAAGTGIRNLDDEAEVGGFPDVAENVHPEGWDANGNYVADTFEAEHEIEDMSDQPEFFTIGALTFDNRAHVGGSYIGPDGYTVNEYQGGRLGSGRLYTWREIYWASLAGDFEPDKWPR